MAEDFIKMILSGLEQEYAASGYEEITDAFCEKEEMIPMGDGVKLRTLLYLPGERQGQYPVILQRTCYPHMEEVVRFHGEQMAKRGYAFLCQFCRGTGGSEGNWVPNIHDRQDGIDTVAWIASQPWAGRIGVWGFSYGAMIGWAMADAVKGMVSSMYLGEYGCDRFVSAYQKGSFRHDVLTSWTMENAGFPVTADYLESCKYMPQIQVDEDLWGKRVDWYRDYISNSHITDEYWQSGWWKTLREIPKKVEIPLYVESGWYDHHHGSTMETWNRLPEETRRHCTLEIGAWNHFGMNCTGCLKAENNGKTEIKNVLRWFEETLVQGKEPDGNIRLYDMGADAWREYLSLDEIETEEKRYFMDSDKSGHAQGLLSETQPEAEACVSYRYDPANPVMTHGAESVLHTMQEVGSLLQPEPGWREDVVSFLSEPLTEPLPLWGKIRAELYVTSDCHDTAFTAKVMEVHENGEAYNIRSSITTIAEDSPEGYVPGMPVKAVVEMWDILYTLQKGSRLRVDISSSDFPQYNVHSNYAGSWANQEKTRVANQGILCGKGHPSALVLPVRVK